MACPQMWASLCGSSGMIYVPDAPVSASAVFVILLSILYGWPTVFI